MPIGRKRLKEPAISRQTVKAPNREPSSNRWKDLWVPVGSLVVALMTTMTTMMSQYQSSRLQLQMKELDLRAKTFELTFKPKQDAYVAFMTQVYRVHEIAISQNTQELPKELNVLGAMYFALDPYIEFYDEEKMLESLRKYRAYCTELAAKGKVEDDEQIYQDFRREFKNRLYKGVFTSF